MIEDSFSGLLYDALYPAVACIKSVEMFQKLSCLPYVFGYVPACVCIACSKIFQKISCLPYVFNFVPVGAKPAHARVSEALLPALWTLSLSFLTNSYSDSKAFQHFIAFLRLHNSSTPCFPFL